jgi:membrane-associated phospholipid phosphatase
MAAIAALIVYFMGERPTGWRRFVRLLYPAFMTVSLYTATGGTMFLLFDRFFDYQLVELEQAILGVEPTLFIDRYWLSPFWTEIFSASYFSYYLMIPVLLLVLYLKRHDDLIRRFLTTGLVAFFISYIMFFLYPIEGPRYYLAGQYLHAVEGPFFRKLVNFAIDNGAVHGGCMPSSHVAVAIVVLAYTFKLSRTAGWLMLPVVIGLAIGTVWGRFHYVTDVFVGAAIGIGAVMLVDRCYSRWTTRELKVVTRQLMGVEHVS